MTAAARELLASEFDRMGAGCPDTAALAAMVRRGGADSTVELAVIGEAAAIGARRAVGDASRLATARRMLAAAFVRLERERGGSLVISGCARAIRNGDWDQTAVVRAVDRALAGAAA